MTNSAITYSTATSLAPTLRELSDLMDKFPPAQPRFGIHLNPKNMELVRKAANADETPHVRFDSLVDVPLYVSDLIQERSLQDQWSPPEGDRFVDYGPEDEHWMRPLGLGTVKTIDMGPLMFAVQERLERQVAQFIFGDQLGKRLTGAFR